MVYTEKELEEKKILSKLGALHFIDEVLIPVDVFKNNKRFTLKKLDDLSHTSGRIFTKKYIGDRVWIIGHRR
jgi:hypothetical protein